MSLFRFTKIKNIVRTIINVVPAPSLAQQLSRNLAANASTRWLSTSPMMTTCTKATAAHCLITAAIQLAPEESRSASIARLITSRRSIPRPAASRRSPANTLPAITNQLLTVRCVASLFRFSHKRRAEMPETLLRLTAVPSATLRRPAKLRKIVNLMQG